MIYELREYTSAPGRMPALVRRFREHTLPTLKKHGIECVFITRTEIGENTTNELQYVLRFESYEQMAKQWESLLTDPAWLAVRKETEADGPLIAKVSRRILSPSEFE
jgi:CHAD domain-containing protein